MDKGVGEEKGAMLSPVPLWATATQESGASGDTMGRNFPSVLPVAAGRAVTR